MKRTVKLPVSRITVETSDTRTFRFDLGSEAPFVFLPGQFIVIHADLWNPRRNRMGPVNRAFSISSSPLEEDYLEITAKRYIGGRMTEWLHDTVRVGQELNVTGPDGDFVFREEETDEVVLIAGGIGIAPFRSIIRYIVEKKLPIQIQLIYSGRTPQDFAFKSELDRLAHRHQNFNCLYRVTREHGGWAGGVGRPDEPLLRNYVDHPRAIYYLCGPDSMIVEIRKILLKLGVNEGSVRSERW